MGEAHDRIVLTQNKCMPHLLEDHFSWGENIRQKVYFSEKERKKDCNILNNLCL